MRENTNKIIVINAIVLYIRLAIITLCSFLTTRYALQALGVVDFGLFSVLGGVTSFVGIINTIMVSTSNRFIAVAVGKKDYNLVNNQFNILLRIHAAIALLTLFIAIYAGRWYIYKYVNFAGDIEVAVSVFNITIIGSILSFIGVPYHGLLMAKEKFFVFCLPDIISHLIKVGIAYLLISHFTNKLQTYSITIAICTALPTLFYFVYCSVYEKAASKIKKIKDWSSLREISSYAGWMSFGAVCTVGRQQGAALLINSFFSTVANTALGIANSVHSIIQMLTHSLTKPFAPQITKNYASGNMERCNSLLETTTKVSFLIMLICACPFFCECNWILSIWLGEVPENAVLFSILIVIDTLVMSFNCGIPEIIFASGKIKWYQIILNMLNICSVLFGYIALKVGGPAYSLLYAYICVSVIKVITLQLILKYTIHYSGSAIVKKSYIPSLVVSILFVPTLFVHFPIHPIIHIIVEEFYLIILIYFIALSKKERLILFDWLQKALKKCKI